MVTSSAQPKTALQEEYVNSAPDHVKELASAVIALEDLADEDYDWAAVAKERGVDLAFGDMQKLYATSDSIKAIIFNASVDLEVADMLSAAKPVSEYSVIDPLLKERLDAEFSEIMYEPQAYLEQISSAMYKAPIADQLHMEALLADAHGFMDAEAVKRIVSMTEDGVLMRQRAERAVADGMPFNPYDESAEEYAEASRKAIDGFKSAYPDVLGDAQMSISDDAPVPQAEPEPELEVTPEIKVTGDDINIGSTTYSLDSGINLGRFLAQYMPSDEPEPEPIAEVVVEEPVTEAPAIEEAQGMEPAVEISAVEEAQGRIIETAEEVVVEDALVDDFDYDYATTLVAPRLLEKDAETSDDYKQVLDEILEAEAPAPVEEVVEEIEPATSLFSIDIYAEGASDGAPEAGATIEEPQVEETVDAPVLEDDEEIFSSIIDEIAREAISADNAADAVDKIIGAPASAVVEQARDTAVAEVTLAERERKLSDMVSEILRDENFESDMGLDL